MKIERIYDKVAETYNQEVSREVLSKANYTAYKMISSKLDSFSSVLAMGIGDGHYLLPYKQQKPELNFHGLDISKQMLEKAEQKLGCKTYHGDIYHCYELVDGQSFDLITAHFILAYVRKQALLKQCRQLLNPEGYLSVVTNTLNSFPNLRAILKNYLQCGSLVSKMVGKHVSKALETVFVPKDSEEIKDLFDGAGFECVSFCVEDIEIVLKDAEAFYQFFIKGGWFASGLVHPLVPEGVIKGGFKQMVKRYVPFPYRDHLNIVIAVAKKSPQ
jgi:ubiquinone/menaquinone biosynthesis C-methylase UbiE